MSAYKNILDELNSGMQINKAHSKEPNWMMAILYKAGTASASNSLTKSDYKNIKTKTKHDLQFFAPIYDHQFSLTRSFASESSSSAIMPDGGLTAHELKVVAPMASIEAAVHEYFSQNVLITSVHLIRITTVGATVAAAGANSTPYHVVAEYMFNHLYISGIASNNDLMCLSFRYASVSYTHNAIDPLTATQAGKSSAAYHNVVSGAGKTSTKG